MFCLSSIQAEQKMLEYESELGPWTSWTSCSVTCGSGVQQRYRFVFGNFSSLRPDNESVAVSTIPREKDEQSCFRISCPQPINWFFPFDCVVAAWFPWGDCNCINGTRTRNRSVLAAPAHGGIPCPHVEEVENCTVECSRDCQLSAWSDWTDCSVTCGAGQQTRNRTVVIEPKGSGMPCELTVHTDPCFNHQCPSKQSACFGLPDGNYQIANCSASYISCVAMQQTLRNCPEQLIFSKETYRCEYFEKVGDCDKLRLAQNSGPDLESSGPFFRGSLKLTMIVFLFVYCLHVFLRISFLLIAVDIVTIMRTLQLCVSSSFVDFVTIMRTLQ